jgi:hypothetical protein
MLEDFKDTLVKYRVANKAKEKGFYCITPHRFLNENVVIGGWVGNAIYKPTKEDIDLYFSKLEELLIAPTPGILHYWLKAVHNISVHTEPVCGNITSVETIFKFYLFVNRIHRINSSATFTDESDAFDEGLYEALCRLP